MIVKQYVVLLGLFVVLLFSGCTKTIYVDKPIEIKVPVTCKVKDVPCHVVGTDPEIVVKLTECIIDLKKEAERCR